MGLVGPFPSMSHTWVIDSNCFIHLGSFATNKFLQSFAALKNTGRHVFYVTPGVHQEVRTVRFQQWKKKPLLLDELKPILTTVAVDGAQVKGLAQLIGEKASPQDVDLSLMVLASQLTREGNEVVLVTDDFKMTTTGEKANLGYSTCPPSTFVQRLAELSNAKHRSALNSLSRRIRAAEMRYAISRVNEYDIQAKLTWMVDSLITGPRAKQQSAASTESEATTEVVLSTALRRTLAGEHIRSKHMKKLGHLPEICAPMTALDEHLAKLSSKTYSNDVKGAYTMTMLAFSEALEAVGLGLAPLGEKDAELANTAIAGYIQRTETALGLMAKMSGKQGAARLHLSRALQAATLIDDQFAEMHSMHQLGLLATGSDDWARAARLFETADVQATSIGSDRLRYLVLSGVTRHLNHDFEAAHLHIAQAHILVSEDKSKACTALMNIGTALLSIDQPGLSLEILDEAMECALESGQTETMDSLAEMMLMAHDAMTKVDAIHHEGLRDLLDGLNTIAPGSEAAFAEQIDAIGERVNEHLEPLEDTWSDWQVGVRLIPEGSSLTVVRSEIDEHGHTLIVVHHGEMGALGLWLPEGRLPVSPGHVLTLGSTRVKVALPTPELQEQHSIRGLVAVEDSTALNFIVPTDDMTGEQ
jgi:rRNA maturation endonuclease Nob1